MILYFESASHRIYRTDVMERSKLNEKNEEDIINAVNFCGSTVNGDDFL